MCGINGYTWKQSGLIERMNHATRFRGPDDEGVFSDSAVTLGHVRLAIVDLSSAGHQPMSNSQGTRWIVYNGEVYNHQEIRVELVKAGHAFQSRTDTEVVLHAYEEYGPECLHRFNGMWSFAIYDQVKQQVVLARDRFGIKPLYYAFQDGRLIFSSMIAGIRLHGAGAQPNERAVMQWLAFNLQHHRDETFFDGVYSLLPGHLLVYDLRSRTWRRERWYTPTATHRGATTGDLRAAFVRSVQRRTMSDVPIGVCLSGGIDSTAITCVLDKHLDEPFNTYSLVVPGSNFDESKYIDEVARHAKIRSNKTQIDAATFLEDLDDFVLAMEEPVTGLSAYAQYQVFKLAHQHGAKVLLDGQGGDEILAGYVYYLGYHFWELFRGMRWPQLAHQMWRSWRNFNSLFPHAMFGFLLMPERARRAAWSKWICPWINHEYLAQVCGRETDPRWRRCTVKESLRQTLCSTSIPHNLLWEDKSAMRFGIESRVPFLDVDFVELAMSLPTEELLSTGETKIAFKRAIADFLPTMIRDRKDKIGFEAPVDELFRDANVSRLLRDIFGSDRFSSRPFWRAERMRQKLEDHLARRRQAGETLWKCLSLELWYRTNFGEQHVERRGAA